MTSEEQANSPDSDLTGQSRPEARRAGSRAAVLRRFNPKLRLRDYLIVDVALAALMGIAANTALNASTGVPQERMKDRMWTGFDDPVGIIVIGLMVLGAILITRLRWTVISIALAVTAFVTVANRQKLIMLDEPVEPADIEYLKTPGFLFSMVSTNLVVITLSSLGALILLGIVLDWLRHRKTTIVGSVAQRRRMISLVACFAMMFGYAVLADFHRDNNPVRWAYERGGEAWQPWNQHDSYRINGFVGGYLWNLRTKVMERPPGYSHEAIDAIADKYASWDADGHLVDPASTTSVADWNIVVVLSESLSDPSDVESLNFAYDPLTNLHATQDQAWSGTAIAAAFGTGTSTMEFQVLTGQSAGLFEPQIRTPYSSFVSDYSHYPSIVGWLAQFGYESIAVHPYSPSLYKRRSVYDTLGFKQFDYDKDFKNPEYIDRSPYISDSTAFEHVTDLLKTRDHPALINLVTMQNHSPYSGWYDNPVPLNGVADDEEAFYLSTWGKGLQHSDEALARFLAEMKQLDRPTLVVFYGDHLGGGLFSDAVLASSPAIARYSTPALIWANTEVPLPDHDLGYISPTDLLPQALSMIGAELPPYYRLLQAMDAEVGAVARGKVVTNNGQEVDESELSPLAKEILADYRMVQYDLSVGKRYGLDRLWYDYRP